VFEGLPGFLFPEKGYFDFGPRDQKFHFFENSELLVLCKISKFSRFSFGKRILEKSLKIS